MGAKGFQGAIAKWGHKRGPMTHGSKHHRRFGSMGAGTDPGRVFPFKKRPGWTGDHKHTAKGIKILKIIDRIDEDNMPESIIVVKGSVAGYTAHTEQGGSYVCLHKKKNPSDEEICETLFGCGLSCEARMKIFMFPRIRMPGLGERIGAAIADGSLKRSR